MTRLFLLAATAAFLTVPVLGAECPSPMDHAMAMDSPTGHSAPADAAHRAMMAGMEAMNADMMAGGTAADIDVAFVCAMIPHHQGAIDMAKAELEHGDDPWAQQMAQMVIDAQTAEIASMQAWLKQQP